MAAANTFGTLFRVTTFGESHGRAIGAVVDGCPAGLAWDQELLIKELQRRRPGTSDLVSARNETDEPEILSGVFEGKTLGSPIGVVVRNHDARPQDYSEIKTQPRTGHADDMWKAKFSHHDYRGGGRTSGRETLARVIGGAVAKMFLRHVFPQMKVIGFVRSMGVLEAAAAAVATGIAAQAAYPFDHYSVRFPDLEGADRAEELLRSAKELGRSYGGVAEITILNPPIGLGQPVFHKLKADLASASMSLGATCSFEIGAGFKATKAEGSEFHREVSGRYGGIRGGIATGEPIVFRVGFKPTSSVLHVAQKGRHDPCIVPRAVPVLEAMTALVLADHALQMRADI